MSNKTSDPTEPMRLKASQYPAVDEGTACTQSSFKVGKRAFLYVGMQGGRYKAMFKLDKSLPEAARRAAKEPDRYEVGSTAWVTARFTAEKPMPKTLWQKWLDESYELAVAGGAKTKGIKKKSTVKTAQRKASPRSKTKKKAAANKRKKKS